MFSVSACVSLNPERQTVFHPTFSGKIGRKNMLYGEISMHRPLANVSHCSHCQCYSVIY